MSRRSGPGSLLRALRHGLLAPWLLLAAAGAGAQADGAAGALPLDGKSFSGSIRATGLLGLFSREGRLWFNGGRVFWAAGPEDEDYLPAPYEVQPLNGRIAFRARMKGVDGDHVNWQGVYDGRQLSDVRAVWSRVKGDFVHDLLLPDAVTLVFTPHR